MKILILLVIVLCSNLAFAAKIADNVMMGAGTISQYVGDVQVSESGEKNGFDVHPVFNARFDNYYDTYIFAPELGFLFPKKGRDPNISKFTYYTLVNGGVRADNFSIIIGTGLVFNRISASGGTEALNNGTGTTEFPLPSGPSTSMNLIFDAAVEYKIFTNWSLNASGWIYNISDSLARSYSYIFAIGYHFGTFKTDF